MRGGRSRKHCVANPDGAMPCRTKHAQSPASKGEPAPRQRRGRCPLPGLPAGPVLLRQHSSSEGCGASTAPSSHGRHSPGRPQHWNRRPAARPQPSPGEASSSPRQESIWAAGNVVPSRFGCSPSWTKTNRAEIPSEFCFPNRNTALPEQTVPSPGPRSCLPKLTFSSKVQSTSRGWAKAPTASQLQPPPAKAGSPQL